MSENKIIVIGGGLIGLAIAIELKLRSASVTVLSRDFHEASAHVAAGMIAPEAEAIPPSPMLDLCLQSRALYPQWTNKLESLTGLSTGYWPCGILAPVAHDHRHRYQFTSPDAQWLDREAIDQHQSGLGEDIVGGWWFPQDAQVDNRRSLARVLQVAAQDLGVEICEGVNVEQIDHNQRSEVTGVETNQGVVQGSHYILATGAWSGKLLPVPVYPKKGQLLSVRVPSTAQSRLPLKQVLFGDHLYLVPRRDGLIVIGATSEDVGFTPHNTPQGVQQLLTQAIKLYPALKDFPIQEFWWGYRPTTPDELPILGSSPFTNLTLAVGHHRNGILLAPITAKLIADLVVEQKLDPLLSHFSWERF